MQRMKCYYLSRCKLGLEWFAAKIALFEDNFCCGIEKGRLLWAQKETALGAERPFGRPLGPVFFGRPSDVQQWPKARPKRFSAEGPSRPASCET